MGNIFSGAVEDLILYYGLPSAFLVLVLVTVYFERRAIRGLDAHQERWPIAPVPRDDASVEYRSPGMTQALPRVPAPVRRWVYVGTAWGVGIGVCAVLLSLGGLLLLTASPLAVVPLAAGAAAAVVAARVLTATLAMGDRERADIRRILARARGALVSHHLAALLLGTLLVALLVVSNRYFWNADPSYQTGQLVDLGLLYGVLVVLPTVVGLTLAHRLRTLLPLYPEDASPKPAGPEPVSGS